MESSDQDAIAEYERLVAEQDAAADAAMQGDVAAETDTGTEPTTEE
jgi:hypothetical protein